MKEPNWETADEEVIWRYVAWHLADNKIDTVLVGGAVCAIYSEGAYQSGDLDFVALSTMDYKIPKILQSIGFEKKSSLHYEHSKSRIFIEFVTGPVGIGNDINIEPDYKEVEGHKLYLLSPTDY